MTTQHQEAKAGAAKAKPEVIKLQAPRVARERHLSPDAVNAAIEQATDRPLFDFIGGRPGVNVLRLNLALDATAR